MTFYTIPYLFYRRQIMNIDEVQSTTNDSIFDIRSTTTHSIPKGNYLSVCDQLTLFIL